MNSKLKEIIDAHFLDIEMNDEAQALHDELSADLNERFEDLLTEGVREEDAIEMIRADLADFDELTRRFPHRRTELAQVDPETISVEGIDDILIRAGGEDLTILPSQDNRIHLQLTGAEKAQWRSDRSGNCLILEIVYPDSDTFANDNSLLGIVLQSISRLTNQIHSEECLGTVLIPAGWRKMLRVQTGSGDIHTDVRTDSLVVKTASGDLDIRLGDSGRSAEIFSSSGDISLTGNTGKIKISTVSGDIDMHGCAGTLSVSTVSGDARLCPVQADTLDFKATSGDLEFQGHAAKISSKTVSGDTRFELTGHVASIRGSAVSGDTRIRLLESQPARTQMRSTSGSIRANCHDGPDAAEIILNSVSGDISIE